ncbi:MAG: tetratricopeptide repeat protein [Deltaproteobacteria bacterium]|uniref:Tetratricopeptide repeat protein n=1 Tax=Candidatus Zymogenus saltonus TaxID=2844893 RepID=A0A9D8KGQ7_9DELT|nr:tetratricopeptide repeat protein [Candidatus Zymogenus saltonus]
MKRIFLPAVVIFILTGFTAAVASDASDTYDKALRDFKRGQYEQAIEGFTKVIKLGFEGDERTSSNILAVYFQRGICYKKLHNWDKALDDFSLVIGFSPTDAQAYYERAGCYKMIGDEKNAKLDQGKACDLDDNYCDEKMLMEKREKKEKEKWWK